MGHIFRIFLDLMLKESKEKDCFFGCHWWPRFGFSSSPINGPSFQVVHLTNIWPILWNNQIEEVSQFLLSSISETMIPSQILKNVFPQRISTPDWAWYSDLTLIFAKFTLTARCKGEMVSNLTPFYLSHLFILLSHKWEIHLRDDNTIPPIGPLC